MDAPILSSAYKSLGNSRKTTCFAPHKSKSSDGCLIKVRTVSRYNHRVEFLICLLPPHMVLKLSAEIPKDNYSLGETKWMLCNVFKLIPTRK